MSEQKKEKMNIRISVRNLVEFILRSGDLDNRSSGADREAMQKGSRIHRKLQGRMGSNYEAEVSLKYLIEREPFCIVIEGRADGILKEEKRIVVDEIKAVYKDLTLMRAAVPLHLAQAKCYACIYAIQNQLSEITVRMTYVQIETEEIRYFYQEYKKEELEQWFLEVIAEYEKWARFQAEWRRIRTESIAGIHFPFVYRNQQKGLVGGVYRTIEQKKRLFIQASTGAGKTISVIYPAVQAVGQKMADKIFYLTAKTITRTVALETFQILTGQNLQFKSIVLTAKEKICFCEETVCNPDACPYARGHYDRVNQCVYDILQKENLITANVIEDYARNYRVCPFELSLDASTWVDAIICDYNYVFDYDVCLKRFFGEGAKEEYIFLIDEAHNLVERGRDMYSAELYKEDILEIRKKVKFYSPKIEKLLGKCNKKMLEWKRECEHYEYMSLSEIGELAVLLTQLFVEIDNFLEEESDENMKKIMLEFYFQIRHFLNIYDGIDENYVIYREYTQGRFKVKLFCVNPSGNLNVFLDKGRAAVFFSATLLPVSYYMKLLSGSTEDYAMYAESPFEEDKRLLVIGKDVSSRYARRNEREYGKIADYIESMIEAKSGNYMVFLPSYVYMQAVYETFLSRGTGVRTIIQENHMTETQREAFLQEFHKEQSGSLAAFCVLGGIFSEGIDLKEDRLIGAIIVGTGMPQIGTERELLQEYFERNEGAGFDYAYRYPGFNKVLQAAGRVIRTEEDQGVVLLLEDRLLGREYQNLYPREWQQLQVCGRSQVKNIIREFWKYLP